MKTMRAIAAAAGISDSAAHQRVAAWRAHGKSEEDAREIAAKSSAPPRRQLGRPIGAGRGHYSKTGRYAGLAAAAERTGIPETTLRSRINRGATLDAAIAEGPPRTKPKTAVAPQVVWEEHAVRPS